MLTIGRMSNKYDLYCHCAEWWFVHVDYEQGWVLALYLEKADGTQEPEGKRLKPGKGV